MKLRDFAVEPVEAPVERSRIDPITLVSVGALVVVAILWLISLASLDPRQMNDYGLVSVLPPAYFVALGLLVVSFGVALRNRTSPGWLMLLHVGLLIGIIYGTPSLAYGTLRYSWAWKHVGMVDFIQRHGTVDPNVSALADLSANQNWPGFFALGTLFTQAGGFTSALGFAPLAPLFFNLIDVGAIWLILSALVRDRRLKWLAVWIFFLANWIGQDYFAPQALSNFLLLVIVGICLTWFSTHPRRLQLVGSGQSVGRLEAWLARLGGQTSSADQPAFGSTPLQRAGLMAMIILSFGVIASSHQLTPLAAILFVGVLVVSYRCSARSLPVLMAVITAMWVIYAAWAFLSNNLQWIVHPFGQLDHNVAVTDLSRLSQGQVVVAIAARALTAFIGILGVAGMVRRWRSGQRDLPYALLAVAPFPLLGITSYGGEMAFRVYFFALPYVAFFAAALFYPKFTSGISWRTPLAVIAISGVLAAGMLLSYYGRERANYFTPDEVAASEFLYNTAPSGSLIIGASFDYPAQFRNYEDYTQVTLAGQGVAKGQLARLQNDPGAAIDRVVGNATYSAVYVIITRSQEAQIEMDNLLPPGTVAGIERFLEQSNNYQLVYRNQDAKVFARTSQQGAAR